jgi:hypothetical protein
MGDLDKLDPNVKRQYAGAYGPFVSGDYGIGSEIPGLGEVIWSYQTKEGLTYVCTGDGFPQEILASEIVAR